MINGWQDPNHFIDEDDAPYMPDTVPADKPATAWVFWAFMVLVILLVILTIVLK